LYLVFLLISKSVVRSITTLIQTSICQYRFMSIHKLN